MNKISLVFYSSIFCCCLCSCSCSFVCLVFFFLLFLFLVAPHTILWICKTILFSSQSYFLFFFVGLQRLGRLQVVRHRWCRRWRRRFGWQGVVGQLRNLVLVGRHVDQARGLPGAGAELGCRACGDRFAGCCARPAPLSVEHACTCTSINSPLMKQLKLFNIYQISRVCSSSGCVLCGCCSKKLLKL